MKYLKYFESGPGGYLYINGDRIYINQIDKKYKLNWVSFLKDTEMSTYEYRKLYNRLRNTLKILGIKISGKDNKINFKFDLNSIPGSITNIIIKERLTTLNIYQEKSPIYLYLGPITKITETSIFISSNVEDLYPNKDNKRIFTTSSADIAYNYIMKYLVQLFINAMSRIGSLFNQLNDLSIPEFKEIILLYLGNNSDTTKSSLGIRDIVIHKDIVSYIHSHIKDSPRLFNILSTIKQNNPILYTALKSSNLFEDPESTDKIDISAGMGDLGF